MDDRTLDAYLARIGATRAATLVELHELHLASVPFENLSIHLGAAGSATSSTARSRRC